MGFGGRLRTHTYTRARGCVHAGVCACVRAIRALHARAYARTRTTARAPTSAHYARHVRVGIHAHAREPTANAQNRLKSVPPVGFDLFCCKIALWGSQTLTEPPWL